MKQTLLVTALASLILPAIANSENDIKSGGATTVFDKSRNAFSLPAGNLGILRRDNFFIGNAFFKQPWVSSPASTKARDGLGPLFNTNTCQSCHAKDGRGRPPATEKEDFLSALVRLSIPATTDAQRAAVIKNGVVAEPNYGDQIQNRAIQGIKPEGQPRLTYQEISGSFKDGEAYTLIKPTLTIEDLAYGDLHPDTMTSVRVAPVMIGLGLLDAISDEDLLKNTDPDDKNNDGISGRVNKVWDVKKQDTVIGRFGWKANQPTISQQAMGAFHGDMGLSTELFQNQNCTPVQSDCAKAPNGGTPEVPKNIMDTVVFYSSTLAVPARRNTKTEAAKKGKALFTSAGCSSCHTPSFTTSDHGSIPELSQQKIHPYTDLLLHDMGEGLTDGRPDFQATATEWRTPPLWGIGLVETVNAHTRFLHDGRARNLSEAILWHGGEAEQSKQRYTEMSKADRDALITFLETL